MIIPQINIICVVDVIAVLKYQTVNDNLWMMDNSDSVSTSGKGTETLSSAVRFGQVINWHVTPVDVQSNIQISDIVFYSNPTNPPCLKLKRYGAPSGEYWAGIVNKASEIRPGLFHYRIEFTVGGKRILMDRFPSLYVSE